MNKQSVSLLTVILSTSLFLVSCGSKMNKTTGNLQFESLKINETAHLFADTSKPACNITIDFTYPTHSTDELLLDTLNFYFLRACFGDKYSNEKPQEAVNRYVSNYINTYRSDLEPLYQQDEKDIEDGSEVASWYSYYKNIESGVQYYDNGLLVYKTHFNEYTGGAHGNYATTYLNIDLSLMRPLMLDDVFVGDYQESITNMIWANLMSEHKAKTREELEEMGFGSTGEIAPIENFYLDNKGITFFYNVYEITPYSMGPVSVTLPYNQIEHWLNSNPVVQALK